MESYQAGFARLIFWGVLFKDAIIEIVWACVLARGEGRSGDGVVRRKGKGELLATLNC